MESALFSPGFNGMPRSCAIRCDFLMLLFKSRLTRYAGNLSARKLDELNFALRYALDL
jgi:mRNA-degrading endonuclease toxin of MazEF toxin-antitoxin module